MKQTKEKETIIVRGIAFFPTVEDDKFSTRILLREKAMEKIQNICNEIGEDIATKDIEFDDKSYYSINVKTSYAIPIFDVNGNQINADKEDYQIYHGADALFKIILKRYEYKEKGKRFSKTGVSAYLLGTTIIKQGEPYQSSTTFDEFENLLDDEEIQF